MNAVDTNVYVYALDADESAKQAKAIALLDQLILAPANTVLLWQVAAELLSQLRKWEIKGRLNGDEARVNFNRFCGMFAIRLPSERVFASSFDLCSRFSLSHWDSMLLAACKDAGVGKLYSEDMASATDYDGITVVNPFA